MQPVPQSLWQRFLVCPVDRTELTFATNEYVCCNGHRYSVVESVPVMLAENLVPTHPACEATKHIVRQKSLSKGPCTIRCEESAIDPFVQDEIVRTCGNMYRHLKGRLTRYPIPDDLPDLLPHGGGQRWFLEVGSNWGRWSIAAAQYGYQVIALDPSLEAILAMRRVAHQLGVTIMAVVADARQLPLRDHSIDVAFSYSVFQHFDKPSACAAIAEMARVTKAKGIVLVQMANRYGIRQLINACRQKIRRDHNPFRVRYWTPRELRTTFERIVGPVELLVDGFFSLNPRRADIDLMPWHYATLIRCSEYLKGMARRIPALTQMADSLWIRATVDA